MEDLGRHSIKVFNLKLAHLIFKIITGFELSKESLAKGRTLIKESLERGLKIMFTKELNVRVLVKELGRGIFNFVEVASDELDCSEKLELVLDLNQVITRG